MILQGIPPIQSAREITSNDGSTTTHDLQATLSNQLYQEYCYIP